MSRMATEGRKRKGRNRSCRNHGARKRRSRKSGAYAIGDATVEIAPIGFAVLVGGIGPGC
jgi:hypothetical protein